MHLDGSKDDLDEMRDSTSGFICVLRVSPSLGALAFCISRRRSSSDVSFVEVGIAIGDNAALDG